MKSKIKKILFAIILILLVFIGYRFSVLKQKSVLESKKLTFREFFILGDKKPIPASEKKSFYISDFLGIDEGLFKSKKKAKETGSDNIGKDNGGKDNNNGETGGQAGVGSGGIDGGGTGGQVGVGSGITSGPGIGSAGGKKTAFGDIPPYSPTVFSDPRLVNEITGTENPGKPDTDEEDRTVYIDKENGGKEEESQGLVCSPSDLNLEFTDEELEQLSALEARFMAIAPTLQTDQGVDTENDNYQNFKMKNNKLEEYVNFCFERSRSPLLTEVRGRVPTPFWTDPSLNRQSFIYTSGTGASATSGKLNFLEKLFKLNIW